MPERCLIKEFLIPTDFDHLGIEPTKSIQSTHKTTEEVTNMIGILAQNDRAQGPPEITVSNKDGSRQKIKNPNMKDKASWKDPELLGVLFDLDRREVRIKPGRRADLKNEIQSILDDQSLSPGHAAKLKGRLFFLTASLFGRVGRAFMRPISERQYETQTSARRARDSPHALNDAIIDALRSWLMILDRGQPRPIRDLRPGPADAVVFTDGSGPEQGETGAVPYKIGAVLFAPWRESPVAFSLIVPEDLIKRWLPRKNQIALVEAFAVVMAISHFGAELTGKRLIALVDSECALDALIKGQSKFEDVLGLLKVFWDLIAAHSIDVYLDRVSTDANPSDGMSRDGEQEAIALGWNIETAKFPEALYKKRDS
jgi:hypothetical protein